MERRLTYLLKVAIERSGAYPLRLNVEAAWPGEISGTPAMAVLGQHSQRWQAANLRINSQTFKTISFTRGNFHLLEALVLHGSFPYQLDIFEGAPRLREVTLRSWRDIEPPRLPWGQLRTLNYEIDTAPCLRELMRLIRRCTTLTAVNFLVDISGLSPQLGLPPVDAHLTCLTIALQNTRIPNSDSTQVTEAFSEIMGTFTLPRIKRLSIRMNSPRPISWPQGQFLTFFTRSSCRETLTSLVLHRMMITDVELLVCLTGLPRLETLAIADVPSVDGSTDHIIVTDALLDELTRTAGTAHLIPHLHVFRFTSLFRFNQQALLDVVNSRVESGRTAAGPFGLEEQWYPSPAT
ncbi:hypothetical protein B0H13DRAFT_2444639 [Mycena leptocephala]|nr:hypothetical protein B0H13DRAFT_2444639 [Mycena leptocephala]